MIREPMTPKNVIDLDGPDGNAFALMALVEGLARDVKALGGPSGRHENSGVDVNLSSPLAK